MTIYSQICTTNKKNKQKKVYNFAKECYYFDNGISGGAILKNIKSWLPAAAAISILTLLLVSCRSPELYIPAETAVSPFEQLFGSSEQIMDLDEDFIAAVISAIYEPYEPYDYPDSEQIPEEQIIEDLPEETQEVYQEPEPEPALEPEIYTEYEPAEDDSVAEEVRPAPRNRIFRLTEHEELLYQKYLSSMDISVLAGETPITVAKIFIMLALNEELEACYYLHARTPGLIPKEQYIAEGKELLYLIDEVTRRSLVNREFGDIDNKEFIQLSETTGYIEHRDIFGFTHRVNFIKHNDVWLIEFFLIN